ncbi:chemotaxis protein CheW [Ferrimonas sediminicola]|nr:chemotaxis protein CheW [Ferrimonas sediminicola]
MSKVAEQALMEYFEVMLTPPREALDEVQKANVSRLLEQAAQPEPDSTNAEIASTRVEETIEAEQPIPVAEPEIESELVAESAPAPAQSWRQELEEEFQCLYFQVAGLVIAVPLLTLGGIKRLGKLSHLPGSPNWVLGVQLDAQDGKLNVVDSGRWFLADRPQTDTEECDFRFVVRLGDSPWSLACESLLDAEPLHKSEVNWQSSPKRPWLAGIVRDKKCVVLDVPELICMLDAGLDITVKES